MKKLVSTNTRNFARYWKVLSVEQKKQLAKRAKTTEPYLRQLANGYGVMSVELAAKIEDASDALWTLSVKRYSHGDKEFPRADRSQFCDTCRKCGFSVAAEHFN